MPYRPPGVLGCLEHIDLSDSRYSHVGIDAREGGQMLCADLTYMRVRGRSLMPPRMEMTDEQAAEHALNMLHIVAVRQPKRRHIRTVWQASEILFGCGPGKILVRADTFDKLGPDEVMVVNGDRSKVGVWITDGGECGLIVHAAPEKGPPPALIFKAKWEDRYWRNIGV